MSKDSFILMSYECFSKLNKDFDFYYNKGKKNCKLRKIPDINVSGFIGYIFIEGNYRKRISFKKFLNN